MLRNTPVVRIVGSTVILTIILACFAQHFDRTELWSIAVWAAVWSLAEMQWIAMERRRGRVHVAMGPCLVLLSVAIWPSRTGEVRIREGESQQAFLARAAIVLLP